MMIEMEFEAHSQMYDMINQGIEMDIILGDENEEDSMYRLSKVEEKLKTDQLEKGDSNPRNSWASKEKQDQENQDDLKKVASAKDFK